MTVITENVLIVSMEHKTNLHLQNLEMIFSGKLLLFLSIIHYNFLNFSFGQFIFFTLEVSLKERIIKGIEIIYSSENCQQCSHVRVWLGSLKGNLSYLMRQLFLVF